MIFAPRPDGARLAPKTNARAPAAPGAGEEWPEEFTRRRRREARLSQRGQREYVQGRRRASFSMEEVTTAVAAVLRRRAISFAAGKHL